MYQRQAGKASLLFKSEYALFPAAFCRHRLYGGDEDGFPGGRIRS